MLLPLFSMLPLPPLLPRRWGWTNQVTLLPVAGETASYTWQLIAGAGTGNAETCSLDKGSVAGTVTATIDSAGRVVGLLPQLSGWRYDPTGPTWHGQSPCRGARGPCWWL